MFYPGSCNLDSLKKNRTLLVLVRFCIMVGNDLDRKRAKQYHRIEFRLRAGNTITEKGLGLLDAIFFRISRKKATKMATISLLRRRTTILLVVRHKNVKKYITLPVKVKPDQWNVKSGKVSKRHPDHLKINEYIADTVSKAQSAMGEHIREGYHDVNTIKDVVYSAIFDESVSAEKSFTEYYREIIRDHEAHDRWERAETQGVVLKHFIRYAESKGITTIHFRTLSLPLMRGFSAFLAYDLNNQHNTIVKKMKALKAVVNAAIRERLFSSSVNIFEGIPMTEIPAKKERLTREELTRIEDLEIEEGSHLWHARNLFCMQVYLAGTRISDTLSIKWEYIKDGRIDFRQIKSNSDIDFALNDSAIKVLSYYEHRRNKRDFVFHFLDEYDTSTKRKFISARDKARAKINKQLVILEKKAEVPRHITTHVARHTFADLARKAGMDIYLISKALGHKSIKQTERYFDSFDSEGVDDMLNQLF